MLAFEHDRRTRAEQLLLGALLRDNGCARHIGKLEPCDFSHDTNGQIFRHIAALLTLDKLASVDSVCESMRRRRYPRIEGLQAYLHSLVGLPAVTANAGYYAAQIRLLAPSKEQP